MINMIACVQEDGGIGYRNQLIWRLPTDLRLFKQITSHAYVVMGRRTYQSLPAPLAHRTNIVLTHHQPLTSLGGVEYVSDPDSVRAIGKTQEVFIIGGATLYRTFLSDTTWLYLTRVEETRPADTFFPPINPQDWCLIATRSIRDHSCPPATLEIYKRKVI